MSRNDYPGDQYTVEKAAFQKPGLFDVFAILVLWAICMIVGGVGAGYWTVGPSESERLEKSPQNQGGGTP